MAAVNPLSGQVATVLGVKLTSSDVVLLLMGVGMTGALTVVLNRSRYGLGVRAVADDPGNARLLGVPYVLVVLATFAIAAGMAGLAGALVAAQYGSAIFDMGIQIGLYGFTAAVLGGMGNVWGAVLGGLLLGVISSLAVTYLPSQWQDAITFCILIIVLAVRPTGLLPTRRVDRA